MPLTPAITQRLVQLAADLAKVPHGAKEALYAAACAELGLSRGTLQRHLHAVSVRPQRKRRSDAGAVALPREEAMLISALLMESHRKNNKRLMSITQAVQTLRDNGLVRAEGVDADGVIRPLSDSAIGRALRVHALHPDQLSRPAPAVELRSLHPNHVWQIDASLCVLYYLETADPKHAGLQVMERDKFYKNKPRNLKRIEHDRVWSYEVTDHYSGCIFVVYVLGAESGENMTHAFIEALQAREGEPFHGVPFIVMTDPGGGNVGALAMNLFRRLQVKPIAHKAGNARATGAVEKARDIIERSFESGLKLRPVANLDELNGLARRWMRWFNGTQLHSRHGQTRYAMWQTIGAEQLRLAPPPALCRELLTHAPERRQVIDQLRVPFMGRGDFDVSAVPGVMVGEWLQVTYNPYDVAADGSLRSAIVVDSDADGQERLTRVPLVERDDAGFAVTGNVIGEDFGRAPDTLADVNRKAVERLAMDAVSLEQAAAQRKAKAVPFGGRIDPFKRIEADDAGAPAWLPRRGTPLAPKVSVPQPQQVVLTLFQAAGELVRRGLELTPERNAQIRAWYPDGVPEAELDDLQRRLTVRATLRVVGGGDAQ
ncbi:MAG: integrase [Proteobacteria bacterium]|nr:integrase [Pseudomonadota bacterium]